MQVRMGWQRMAVRTSVLFASNVPAFVQVGPPREGRTGAVGGVLPPARAGRRHRLRYLYTRGVLPLKNVTIETVPSLP